MPKPSFDMSRLTVLINKKNYGWQRELSAQAIEERAVLKKTAMFVGVLFFLIAGAATASFLFLGFLSHFSLMTPNFGSFLFFVALLFLLISISHLKQTNLMKQTIPVRSFDDPAPSIIPSREVDEEIDISPLFDFHASGAVDQAFALAKQFGHAQVDPLHLFVATLSDETTGAVISRLQIQFDKIKDPLGRRLASRQLGDPTFVSETAEQVLLAAFVNAYMNGRRVVNTFEVFFEAFLRDEFIQELFFDQGVTVEQFANMVAWVRIHEKMREQYEAFRRAAQFKPTGAMNRAMTSVATPALDTFSEDLTTAAVQGRTGILVERDKELSEIFRVIEGGRQSVVLVGSEGVGKLALLEGIAALMVEERVPAALQDKRFVRISLPHLLSGAEPQEAQERLMLILLEVMHSGNIILAIDNLDQITSELANVLVDFLSRGSLFVIATTTPQGYFATVERSVLGRVFEKVVVSEPEPTSAIRILESKALGIEAEHHVSFTYRALESVVKLCDRFMHESYLPKKAIEVARETALMVSKERGTDAQVTVEDVERIISEKTGVPTTHVANEEKDTLLHMEERMHGRMVGQSEAVNAVAAALRRARTQLRSEQRPIATFLFLGPTGVGKTELAKTVAETYFGNEENMIRLDMSEYQQPDSLVRLIGRPGENEGGLLTQAVRQQPFALVLLDEFEKSDANILNLFLQVFDDGRLTDAAGRTIDFTNTIIIATSNAGSSYIQEAIRQKLPKEEMKTHLLEEELKGIYRPELLNRFDGVVVFSPLTQEEIVEITRRMIATVAGRLEAKGIHFRAADELIVSLAQRGYDPEFGARSLRRLVQEEIDNAIAQVLLKDEVKRRDTIVLESGGIRIEPAPEL